MKERLEMERTCRGSTDVSRAQRWTRWLCLAATFSLLALVASVHVASATTGRQTLASGHGFIAATGQVVAGAADRDLWWNGGGIVPGIAGYSAGPGALASLSTVDAKRLVFADLAPHVGELFVFRVSAADYNYLAIRVTAIEGNNLTFEWTQLDVEIVNETPCRTATNVPGTMATNRCVALACPAVMRAPSEMAYTAVEQRACRVRVINAMVATDLGPRSTRAVLDPRGIVIEGDIRLHPDQLVGGPARGTGRTSIAAHWPGGRIPYTIDSSIVNNPADPDDLWDRVQWAVNHWNTQTPVQLVAVTPVPGRPCGTRDDDCVTFRVGTGCSSSVGRTGGQQFIDLTTGCVRGSVAHEIGHAVGLFHEQSAENRDQFVKIHAEHIQPGQEHNFDIFTKNYSDGTDYTPYDYDSIMHYGATAFSRDGQPTIERLDGGSAAAMGQRNGLSARDRAAVEAMYGSFAFSYRGTLPGRQCIATPEPADPHNWHDNYFCTNKPGARWSYAGPIGGLRCTQINEPADPHTWNDNYLCVDPSWREHFTWSYNGPVAGQRCIAFNEPSDPDAWSDNFLCWVESAPDAPSLKSVKVRLSDIDDDAFVWIGGAPGETNQAICAAHFANGHTGSNECDMTARVKSMGLGYEQRFTIKFGNGGGWDSQGRAEIVVDGRQIWSHTKTKAVRHTGWFYRVVLAINFVSGTVAVREESECRNIWDCPN